MGTWNNYILLAIKCYGGRKGYSNFIGTITMMVILVFMTTLNIGLFIFAFGHSTFFITNLAGVLIDLIVIFQIFNMFIGILFSPKWDKTTTTSSNVIQ